MINRNAIIALVFAFVAVSPVFSQKQEDVNRMLTETNVPALRQLSTDFGNRFSINHALALQLAGQRGWVIRQETPDGKIMELMGVDEHGNPRYYTTTNLAAAQTISTSKVWTGGGLGLSLSGTGLTLREWDGGKVRTTHQELTGRVTLGDGASSFSSHSTHVAGTMIASGVTAAAKGMSYQASLRAFEWTDDFSEMTTEAAAGALLSNHSYGYISGWYTPDGTTWTWYGDENISAVEDYTFGFYSTECNEVDDIACQAPYYLICKSAGNDRGDYNGSGPQEPDGGADGFDCITDFGNAKNLMTVGAVYDIPGGYSGPSDVVAASFSNWGPTDDGRIKPDICANGIGLYSCNSTTNTAYTTMSGTSMSSPSACGSMMLLQQHYYNLNTAYMKAATLKGLVIHTADEAGSNPGPDYSFGWGLMNTATAAQVISQRGFISQINEATLSNGGTYTLNVNSNGDPLKVTICWTDPKGTTPAASLNPTTIMLVNDLDVRVDGTWQPWVLDRANPSNAATQGDNIRDNVEQILIPSPTAGSHTITVTHKGTLSGGSQNFSIIVTGIYTGIADPSPFTATATSASQINLNWTKNASNDNVMVAWSTTETFGTPVNGTTYTSGSAITGGGTVLYTGSAAAFSHMGLTSNTTYYYRIWSVNGSNNYSYGRNTHATTPCVIYNSFPITETFTGITSLPACWSQESTSGSSDWSISATTKAGGSANELVGSYSNVTSGTTRGRTFFFNTVGISTLDLSFLHFFDDYAAGCTAKIQSSTDGVNWTDEAWSIASGSGNISGSVSTTITHNLNSPTTMIAFVLTGNLYNFDYWYIDNVTIKAPGYWVGGTVGNLTNWNTTTNWGDGVVPTASTNVIIPPRTYLPIITNDAASPAQCNNMLIINNATVTVSPGKKLVVNGNVTMQPGAGK